MNLRTAYVFLSLFSINLLYPANKSPIRKVEKTANGGLQTLQLMCSAYKGYETWAIVKYTDPESPVYCPNESEDEARETGKISLSKDIIGSYVPREDEYTWQEVVTKKNPKDKNSKTICRAQLIAKKTKKTNADMYVKPEYCSTPGEESDPSWESNSSDSSLSARSLNASLSSQASSCVWDYNLLEDVYTYKYCSGIGTPIFDSPRFQDIDTLSAKSLGLKELQVTCSKLENDPCGPADIKKQQQAFEACDPNQSIILTNDPAGVATNARRVDSIKNDLCVNAWD